MANDRNSYTNLVGRAVLATGLAAAALAVSAFTVNIDPGAFTGNYQAPITGNTSGFTSVDLAAGTYVIANGTDPGGISFSVSATGVVTSNDLDSATSSGNTLALRNETITVEAGGFSGGWFGAGGGNTSGTQTRVVIPDMKWAIGNGTDPGSVFFVDKDGLVTTEDPDSTIGDGTTSTLTFRNKTITVEAGAYSGGWFGAGGGNTSGTQSRVVIPDMKWAIGNGTDPGSVFFVDQDGLVTTEDPGSTTADGTTSTLTFRNTTIAVDPVNYTGGWFGAGGGNTSGLQNRVVIPDMKWAIGNGTDSGSVFFVDENGLVTTLDPDSSIGDGTGTTLELRNTLITINPAGYEGGWFGAGGGNTSGLQSRVVIPDMKWAIGNGADPGLVFFVDALGEVDSLRPLAATGSGSTLTFENVLLRIDPTTYTGTYSGTGFPNSSGIIELLQIADLLQSITAGGVSENYSVLDSGAVPGSVDLTIAGQTHTFLLTVLSVPEPPLALLLGAGFAGLLLRSVRRRNRLGA